jgi:hypothetical protein
VHHLYNVGASRRRPSPWLVIGLTAISVAGWLVLGEIRSDGGEYDAVPPLTEFDAQRPASEFGTAGGRPTPGADASDVPLGQPDQPPDRTGNHEFLLMQPTGDEPKAWNPCRRIHVVVNGHRAFPRADHLLRDALDAVTRATGLQFVVDGETDESPSLDRKPFQPDRYGDRWAPVLVAWTDEEDASFLEGGVVGLTKPIGFNLSDPSPYLSGTVVLDGPFFDELLRGDLDEYRTARAIVLHELGHLVGLDHVDDDAELMSPELGLARQFGAGDLHGLARLGRGPCFPEL